MPRSFIQIDFWKKTDILFCYSSIFTYPNIVNAMVIHSIIEFTNKNANIINSVESESLKLAQFGASDLETVDKYLNLFPQGLHKPT